jgi:hypothetical protein
MILAGMMMVMAAVAGAAEVGGGIKPGKDDGKVAPGDGARIEEETGGVVVMISAPAATTYTLAMRSGEGTTRTWALVPAVGAEWTEHVAVTAEPGIWRATLTRPRASGESGPAVRALIVQRTVVLPDAALAVLAPEYRGVAAGALTPEAMAALRALWAGLEGRSVEVQAAEKAAAAAVAEKERERLEKRAAEIGKIGRN